MSYFAERGQSSESEQHRVVISCDPVYNSMDALAGGRGMAGGRRGRGRNFRGKNELVVVVVGRGGVEFIQLRREQRREREKARKEEVVAPSLPPSLPFFLRQKVSLSPFYTPFGAAAFCSNSCRGGGG